MMMMMAMMPGGLVASMEGAILTETKGQGGLDLLLTN